MSSTALGPKYIEGLVALFKEIEWPPFDHILERIQSCENIYCCGNGGSYANASHLVLHLREVGLSAYDLMADNATVTAYSNDYGYEKVLARQLRDRATKKDILIVISGSGDSPNIIMALAEARRIGMGTIGFLGFGGGMAKAFCDMSLMFHSQDYGQLEDVHSAIAHIIKAALYPGGNGSAAAERRAGRTKGLPSDTPHPANGGTISWRTRASTPGHRENPAPDGTPKIRGIS